MTTLRQHDKDATLAPACGWRERVAGMDNSFRWARITAKDTLVAMISGDVEKAYRLAKVAAGFAIEGFKASSCGW